MHFVKDCQSSPISWFTTSTGSLSDRNHTVQRGKRGGSCAQKVVFVRCSSLMKSVAGWQVYIIELGGCFKQIVFLTLPGEMIQFEHIVQMDWSYQSENHWRFINIGRFIWNYLCKPWIYTWHHGCSGILVVTGILKGGYFQYVPIPLDPWDERYIYLYLPSKSTIHVGKFYQCPWIPTKCM